MFSRTRDSAWPPERWNIGSTESSPINNISKNNACQAQWLTPLIPALGNWRQEDHDCQTHMQIMPASWPVYETLFKTNKNKQTSINKYTFTIYIKGDFLELIDFPSLLNPSHNPVWFYSNLYQTQAGLPLATTSHECSVIRAQG